MGKAHKLDGTGLGLDTALSAVDLRSICVTAAPQATGTLWKGQERITLVHDSEGLLVFEMPALIKAIKRMVFSVAITENNGRRQLLTTINDYMTTRWMLWGIIPLGPREITGHYVYVEFLELTARTVRDADPTAVAVLELAPHQQARIPRVNRGVGVASRAPAPAPPSAPTTAATSLLTPESAPADARTPEPVAEPEPEPRRSMAPEPEPPIDQTTAVARRPRSVHWSIEAEDGSVIDVVQRTVIGREPKPVARDDAVAVVGVEDTTVSASHAVLEVRGTQLVVTDLGSTNGTVVLNGNLNGDGNEYTCTPGQAVEVADGATIELGAYTLVARREMRRAR